MNAMRLLDVSTERLRRTRGATAVMRPTQSLRSAVVRITTLNASTDARSSAIANIGKV